MTIDIIKVLLPSAVAFFIGIAVTPAITHYLYSRQMWKKRAGKVAPDGSATPIFNKLHEHKEVGTPKMGGTVIWIAALGTTALFWLAAKLVPGSLTIKLEFLSRNQTWLPLFGLVAGGLFGLIDDYLDIAGSKDHVAGGLSLKKRLFIVGTIGILCGLWFYLKLDVSSVGLFNGAIDIGALFVPFFALVMIGIYSGGVIDGIDGLAGGIFAAIFGAYAGIAFSQNQIDLATLSAVIAGGILAFLWFNVPPARFYMSETGSMGLTIALTIIAFLTDAKAGGHGIIVLPIIAFPLVATTLSDVIQMLSKKIRGKKVFLVAPIHHHFEAIGWPAYKVTMRYWIIGVMFAVTGLIIGLIR